MNIYFAGSIKGGREKQKDYLELIGYCKNFGNVLTEHLGNTNTDIIDEVRYAKKEDEHVYLRDIDWLSKSDILIAEVTVPSLGVGYEIGYAEKLNKKILCLYNEGSDKELSRMLSGNKNLTVKRYKNNEEAKNIIKDYLLFYK